MEKTTHVYDRKNRQNPGFRSHVHHADAACRGIVSYALAQVQTDETTAAAQLSTQELQVYTQLKQLQSESLWGVAIREALVRFELPRFLRLIIQLKGQAADNPESMKKILGPAYEAVIRL